jgi:uncharacterized protein
LILTVPLNYSNPMLQVNVSQMLKNPIGAVRVVPVDDELELDSEGRAHAVGNARLTRTNRSILVQADLDTEVNIECARCLETYVCPLKVKFDEEFFPTMDVNSGTPLPEPEEPDAFTIDERLTLDLSEATRQYILTSLPMKPLCRPDCPGITI